MTDNVSDNGAKDAQKEPTPGTPEYDEKMASVARAAREENNPYKHNGMFADDANAGTKTDDKPQRPDHIPEKFWDAEKGQVNVDALAKSYAELEKVKQPQAKTDATVDDASAKDTVEQVGLDWNNLTDKINTNGKLDDADYTAFEKAGVTREVVDDYIRLKQAEVTQRAFEYIGGQKAAEELIAWATTNLSDEEKVRYNAALSSEDWMFAVDSLKAKREAARKTAGEPRLVGGVGASGAGVSGYQTKDEQRADMADPLYFDPGPKGNAFRKQVEQKTMNAAWLRK